MTNQEACARAIEKDLVSSPTEFWKGAKKNGADGKDWLIRLSLSAWIKANNGTILKSSELAEDWEEFFSKEGFKLFAYGFNPRFGRMAWPSPLEITLAKPQFIHLNFEKKTLIAVWK